MSIAMVNQPPVAIYREDQWFSPWVYALLGGMLLIAMGLIVGGQPFQLGPEDGANSWRIELPLAVVIGLSLPPMLVLGVLRMTTEVTPTELRVWFGLVPTYRHVVPAIAIQSVEPVRYRPLRDYAGWGIRRGPEGERALTARGDRGVRITMTDGTTLLIGTQRPEELARTLDRAVRNLS